MLNLPRKTLTKIKSLLLRQQKDVASQIKSIEIDDPVVEAAIIPEVLEPGTESWMAEVHGRLGSIKNDLLSLSDKIKNSLQKLNRGTYGKCEKCHKPIELGRLEAMPTATLCLSCTNKSSKKK